MSRSGVSVLSVVLSVLLLAPPDIAQAAPPPPTTPPAAAADAQSAADTAAGSAADPSARIAAEAAAVTGPVVSTAGLPAGSVRLSWPEADPGEEEEVRLSGYAVGRSAQSRVNPAPWSTEVPPSTRSWVFAQLVPGQTYQLWVAARRPNGLDATVAVTYRYLPAGFRPSAPAAPTMPALQWISRDSVALTWLAPDSDGGAPLTSYTVSRDGRSSVGTGALTETYGAGVRRKTFIKLIPGATYTFSITATNRAGTSRATTVTYTVPTSGAAPVEPVYTLDRTTRTAVRIQDGSPVTTLGTPFTDPVALAVDRQRTVYVADAGGSRVVRLPADGSAPTAVGTGWSHPDQIEVDDRGDVFVLDRGTGTLSVITARDGRQRVLGTGVGGTLGVDGRGTASVFGLKTAAIFPADGEAPVRVQVLDPGPGDFDEYVGGIVSRTGESWVEGINVTSAAYAHYIYRILPVSFDRYSVGPYTEHFAQAVDGRGTYFQMRDAFWCPSISQGGPNPCTPDPTVNHIDRYAPGSVTSPVSIPTSGLTLPFTGVAADLSGSLVVSDDGGLYRVAPQGGPATLIANGTFSAPELAQSPVG